MSRASHRDAIHALLDAGISRIPDIQARVGCSENVARVYRTEWRRLHGLGPMKREPLRRQQVAELDAQGLSNTEIGARLGISAGAVSVHRIAAGLPPRMQQRKSPGATGKTWKKEAVQVPDLGRCACGLLLPCTCDGKKRSAVEFMGRRGEPFMGATGW